MKSLNQIDPTKSLLRVFLCGTIVFCFFGFSNCHKTYGQSAATPDPQPHPATGSLTAAFTSKLRELDNAKMVTKTLSTQLDRISQKREAYFTKQLAFGVTQESFGEVMRSLQGQRIQLMIDIAGIEARKTALEEARETPQQDDKMVQMLNEKLAIVNQNYKARERLVAQGSAPQKELNAAKLLVLETEMELENARKPKSNPILNQELLSVSLDRTEKIARLAKTEELLKKVSPARDLLIAENEIARTSELLIEELEEAKRNELNIELDIRSLKDEAQQLGIQLD